MSNHIKTTHTNLATKTQRERKSKRDIAFPFGHEPCSTDTRSDHTRTFTGGARFAFHSHLPHCVVSGFKLLLSPLTPYRCDKVIIMVHRILSVALFFPLYSLVCIYMPGLCLPLAQFYFRFGLGFMIESHGVR